jgi:hypothetical protein
MCRPKKSLPGRFRTGLIRPVARGDLLRGLGARAVGGDQAGADHPHERAGGRIADSGGISAQRACEATRRFQPPRKPARPRPSPRRRRCAGTGGRSGLLSSGWWWCRYSIHHRNRAATRHRRARSHSPHVERHAVTRPGHAPIRVSNYFFFRPRTGYLLGMHGLLEHRL